jgi:hypothetical protein
VFLAPPGQTELPEGLLSTKGHHETTDDLGRFALTGEPGEEIPPVIVLAPALHAWLVPVTNPTEEMVIALPEPASLVVRYEIAGSDPKAQLRVQLKTWDMPDWRGVVEHTQRKYVENGKEVVFESLAPGAYDFSRDKVMQTGDLGITAMCDRQTVTLAPGERKVVELVRPTGASVSVSIAGLDETKAPGAIVTIRAAGATGDPRGEDWKLTTYDGRFCRRDGVFVTSRLAPGRYTAVAHAYEPLTDERRFRTGWILPDFVGVVRFEIPETGEPAPVRIPLERYSRER